MSRMCFGREVCLPFQPVGGQILKSAGFFSQAIHILFSSENNFFLLRNFQFYEFFVFG